MNSETPSIDITPLVELTRASQRIQNGRKGMDFLVLQNDDEMYGYKEQPLETEFCVSVNQTLDLLNSSGTILLTEQPQLGGLIIQALVQVQLAVDAYRSRMYKYATDWGSEISPVANCQRKLFDFFRETLTKLSKEDKHHILKLLSDDLRTRSIITYFWSEWDRHGSSSIRVVDLFI